MGRARLQRYQRAFALPTVLITSVVMLIVLLSALTAATSISAGLKNQYANQLARTASQSGMTMAQACIEGNDGAITWSTAKPLKPNTDCEGNETTSCPNSATAAACYVLKSGNYRTTFKVKVITDSNDNPIDVEAQGIVREVRKTSGDVITESKTSLKAKLQNVTGASGGSASDGSLVTFNGGSCAIADGTLYCWGYNAYGQLGIGSSSYGQTPTAVAGLLAGKSVSKVSGSSDGSPGNLYAHACAIADGAAYCWGYNGYYQVDASGSTRNTPVLMAGGLAGKTVTDITTFNGGSCAIADGTLYCWGYSGYGQLGNGSSSYVSTPTAVAGGLAGKRVTKVSSSFDADPSNLYGHTCAIADGAAYCFGYNAYYQLGNGNTTTQYSPVLIAGGLAGKTVTDITTFNGGTCAIAGGTLYCWGYGNYGQLGNGSSSANTTPTAVAGVMAGKTVTKVSSSSDSSPGSIYAHTCAIADGAAYCWGYNGYYQVGNGNTATQYSPVLMAGGLAGKTVTDIITFNVGTCATADGIAYCWGYNTYGQLGIGSSSYGQTPTAVAGVMAGKTVTRVSGSFDANPGNLYGHTCAIASGSLYCFGYNGYYQVDNSGSNRNTPVMAGNDSALPGGPPSNVTVGGWHTCALGSDKKAYCWGRGSGGEVGNGSSTTTNSSPVAVAQGAMPTNATIKSISSGEKHTCVIASDDKAYCWGENDSGKLGNNSTSTSYSPVAVAQGAIPAGVTLKSVTAGAMHSCAIGSDDKAYCWGYNVQGQLGNNSTNESRIPVAVAQGAVPTGVTFKSITIGYLHSCALGTDNKAYCWGSNSFGGLGNGGGNTAAPAAVVQGAVPAGVTFKSISAGYSNTCAVGSNDKAYCWGYNYYGSLGNGTSDSASNTSPVAVLQGAIPAGATIKSVAGGASSSAYVYCAIASDDKAYCWGNGSGMGGGSSSSTTPVAVSQGAVPGGVALRSISLNQAHTCAVASNSKIYCWGNNLNGRLGDGTTSTSSVPIQVRQGLNWGAAAPSQTGNGEIQSYLKLTY